MVAQTRCASPDRTQDHARAQRCMTMAIHYEADSETLDGQRAVAQVILNRVAHPAYPSTVCGVVFQGSERVTGCQFSFTCDGTLVRRAPAAFGGSAARVAREALSGIVYAPVGLATHYHTTQILPYWASSLDQVGVVGAHVFYRWRGAAGRKAGLHEPLSRRRTCAWNRSAWLDRTARKHARSTLVAFAPEQNTSSPLCCAVTSGSQPSIALTRSCLDQAKYGLNMPTADNGLIAHSDHSFR